MPVKVLHGDMRAKLAELIEAKTVVHSIVTDPPYHLTSIVKRFGKTSSSDANDTGARARAGADPMTRSSRGFMGQTWDGGDIAFDPETWRLCYHLLPPGGWLLAFSATRTYHRMACAIEDAGFEIRDMVSWIYGSGFPKSFNVSKAIDRAAGVEPTVIGKRRVSNVDMTGGNFSSGKARAGDVNVTEPTTAEAKAWKGWGTALKPALEPICVARKPVDGTVANNVLEHGTGALNIDACRVSAEERAAYEYLETTAKSGYSGGIGSSRQIGTKTEDRWPANVVHDGSDEVMRAFPMQSSGGTPPTRQSHGNSYSGGFHGVDDPRGIGPTSGSAARFFYSAKAGEADRLESEHPTVKPVDLMRWLIRLVTPPRGTVLDPFAGSGTTGMAAMAEGFDAILVEREAKYVADILRRIDHVAGHDTPLFAK
jgi:site-specific DNA-methyltransferase (adenine-specific)